MSGADRPPLADDFDRPAVRGTAIGAVTHSGHRRGGVDIEGMVAVDEGGGRLGPLARPGWGRAGLAYGPWPPTAGLAFAVHFVNGHNAAQDHPPRSRPRLIGRWMAGSGTDAPWRRVAGLLRHVDRESRRHRLRRYLLLDRTRPSDRLDPVNLAVGWLAGEAPLQPDLQPGAVVVAGAAEDSGVLSVVGPRGPVVVRERIGELPLQVVAVWRGAGVGVGVEAAADADAGGGAGVIVFVAIGVDDGQPPRLEPVALVANGSRVANRAPEASWAGVHQRVMGEIGFGPDTRVYQAKVASVGRWDRWWTTALAADRLTGHGPLRAAPAETGQTWQLHSGSFRRTPRGLVAERAPGLASLDTGAPVGLLHAVAVPGPEGGEGGVLLHWRFVDAATSWRLHLDRHVAAIERVEAGAVIGRWAAELAPGGGSPVRADDLDVVVIDGGEVDVVVIDDGPRIRVLFDGRPIVSAPAAGPGRGDTTIGIGPLGRGWALRDVEAHPRTLAPPPELTLRPRRLRPGCVEAWTDRFAYARGELAGRRGPAGTWQRILGRDRLEVAEADQVQVVATVTRPAHGRTLYTVGWDQPDFADLAVTIRPPGTRRGAGHRGRGGLVLWQDDATYVVVNTWLDDAFAGSSVSVFPHLGGFEDVFDAVWVNVGERIRWGAPYRLRVVCDGDALLIYADGDQVLYRRLADIAPAQPRLAIRRVGLAVNWEWGTDTGTTFSRLEARLR